MLTLNVNGADLVLDVPGDMPLLWVLREKAGLTGTKFGCGMGQCGACTVHVDGAALRSCVLPAASLVGKRIVTIEGLANGKPHRLQQAWIELNVPQCGYCQAGQLMTAAALLAKHPHPDDLQINEAMAGNLCRCGTYPRIRAAIHRAASG